MTAQGNYYAGIRAISYPYKEIDTPETLPRQICIGDHLTGFDQDFNNAVLQKLNDYARLRSFQFELNHADPYLQLLQHKFPNLKFVFNPELLQAYCYWPKLFDYTVHPDLDFENFVCSFNGSPHIDRQLLVAILHRFDMANEKYVSKNFTFDSNMIDGHLQKLAGNQHRFYRKLFIGPDSDQYFKTPVSFEYQPYDHLHNVKCLENQLTQSFLHIVGETQALSYCPRVTEKFLYSIVTRGLFLVYGQPYWHSLWATTTGFKPYTKIFDYRFDKILNPVERLVEMITMVLKFKVLSKNDLHDLYLMEQDTIEFNYDHFFSKAYLKYRLDGSRIYMDSVHNLF